MPRFLPPAVALLSLLGTASAPAQTASTISDRGLDIPFQAIGTIQPRHARDIAASNWSVGGETLDRDYADYHSYNA